MSLVDPPEGGHGAGHLKLELRRGEGVEGGINGRVDGEDENHQPGVHPFCACGGSGEGKVWGRWGGSGSGEVRKNGMV